MNGAKDLTEQDFMPDAGEQPRQTWQEQLAIVEAMAARIPPSP
ncbi:hypothetical protein [Candidatus Nitrospira bockiana]